MSSVQQILYKFNNKEHNVYITQDNQKEFWFKAKDIAIILEYKDISKTIVEYIQPNCRMNWEQLKKQNNLSSASLPSNWQPKAIFINEAGLYQLVMISNKPEAQNFRSWVTGDVLPSIRKTGQYSVSSSQTKEISQTSVDTLVELVKSTQNENKRLQQLNQDKHDKFLELCDRMMSIIPKVAVMTDSNEHQHVLEIYQKGNTYKFIRTQQKILIQARKAIDLTNYQKIYYRNKIPNSMNILNKVKELLYKDMVQFTSKYNEITTDANILNYIIKMLHLPNEMLKPISN